MKLTDTQLDKLEKAAKEATPGPWRIDSGWVLGANHHVIFGIGEDLDADLEYAVTMDPTTTLALVAEVKAQRAAIAEIREIHREGYVKPVMACLECENYDYPCDTIQTLNEVKL